MVSLLQGRKLPTTSTVISACGGKKGKERVLSSPAQAQGAASPGGAQSIRRPGESGVRCGAFCAKERLLSKRVGPVWPQNCLLQPSGLLFPFFKCLHMCGRTNTDIDTIN